MRKTEGGSSGSGMVIISTSGAQMHATGTRVQLCGSRFTTCSCAGSASGSQSEHMNERGAARAYR